MSLPLNPQRGPWHLRHTRAKEREDPSPPGGSDGAAPVFMGRVCEHGYLITGAGPCPRCRK